LTRLRGILLLVAARFARFDAVARCALWLRNVCNVILRERLSDGLDPERNGEAAVARALAPASSTFVDVGANVGDWSALFCGLAPETARGLLLEPAEVTVRQLQERFADRAAITVVCGAASDRVGRAQFFEGTGASEASSLLESSHRAGATAREVELTTVDELLARFGIDELDFLKIDAEGYDLHVLRGARSALEQQRVGAIQFEYHKLWAAAGSTLGEAINLLELNRYALFRVRGAGIEPVTYEPYRDYFGYSNYLAVSPRRRAEVEALTTGG